MNFTPFNFHPQIAAGIRASNYETPTLIQRKAIPAILEGRDILGLAQTGTGKTAAFVLPILQRLLKGRQPASLKSCVLLRKERDSIELPIHYLGFEIPDVWVVGYGLDFADTYRTLPFIAELKKEAYMNEG